MTTAAALASIASHTVTASVPGRWCLAGESLDWMVGGPSVTAAVPLRTRVTAWHTHGDNLSLSSGSPVQRTRLIPAQHVAERNYNGDVLDYLQAAAWVTLTTPERIAGMMLTASTELPVSAGLSSSAALTIGAVAALSGLYGHRLPPLPACQLAREAETGELGTGAGWMDYLACAYGGVNHVDATAVTVLRLRSRLGIPVVVIDTMEHRATSRVLASKRDRFRAGEPDITAYAAQAPYIVHTLTDLLNQPRVDLVEVGRLITVYHELLRDLVRCSTDLIDICVERVLKAGALGAKLSGSGHGGCVVALVPEEAVNSVLASVAGLPVHATALPDTDPHGLTIDVDEESA
ncbi:galactokinase [Kitasatospora sp. MAP12-15]|uniref:mevalonate kinase family protein n=1 Tax=unclassified Kitasatospora TaxID=2633591 RepID=UPI002474D50D|nr:hypothetical protein [Kitasatospora sp. MAP12-44]MDH6111393.1 galactokinase [Kitasatospora sp. MAP12-44]